MSITLDKNINQNLKNLAEDILHKAKNKGATAAELSLSEEQGFSVNIRLNEVDTIIHNRDKQVELTVYFGQRSGSASSTDLCAKSLDELVTAACTIAKYTDNDPCSGLADASLMATHFPDLDDYYPWDLTPDAAINLAKQCESMAMADDKRLHNSDGAWVETHCSANLYANSHGFNDVEHSTYHSMGVSLIAKQGDEMQREGDYSTAIDAADLMSVQAIAQKAAQKTTARLGSRRLKTQKAAVLFACDEACSLFRTLTSAISGYNLYRKSSFLLDSLGEKILPDFINIYEQPYLKKGLGSASYDGNGVATRDKHFVRDGIVESYILSQYSANQLKMQTTANAGGVFNLTVDNTHQGFADMLKTMHTGFLVTELMGQGINMVTGDYSRGAAGFWVENGKIKFPVHEVTIAGNLKDMFKQIVAVGNDRDPNNSLRSGSVLIESMMIAGA